MPLSPGVRLGPYEIVGALGAGGMGEVYRARDTRLDRSVAIKVLAEGSAGDADRRRRFEQEARAVSALNHPHICTLYDIGSGVPSGPDTGPPSPEPRIPNPDPLHYLVMECIEGETLAHRLEKGPLPLDEVLRYGIEVADALAAAHSRGIVHRDLKPANVMLTKSGVKLLDFGLAKLKGSSAGQTLALSAMATGAAPATAEGTLLGTLSYMAPEQVEARETDARTDLFACGAVLYEMATGRRAFEGGSAASVIAAILEREPPPLSVTAPASPPMLDRIIRACLAKNPDERIQSARDVGLQLTWLREMAGSGVQPGAGVQAAAGPALSWLRRRPWLVAASAFVLGAAIMAASFVRVRPSPAAPRSAVRFTIEVPATRVVSTIALSPDGGTLAYVGTEDGQSQVYLRRMNQSDDAPVAGTRGADPHVLGISPDGSQLAFASGPALKTVPAAGGDPATLVQAPASTAGQQDRISGVDWARDGSVLFTVGTTGVWLLPESGSAPVRLTATDAARGEYSHTSPILLPDGRHALVTVHAGMPLDDAPLVAVDTATRQQQRLLPDGARASYIDGGHLLYVSGSSLLAAPFDPSTVRLGNAVPVIDYLDRFAPSGWRPRYAVSRAGDLAYVTAEPPRPAVLVRLDRMGREEIVTNLPPGTNGALSLSPDGRRLASYWDRSSRMWPSVIDVARGIPEELPLDRDAHALVWLPDGQRLAFSSNRDGVSNIYVRDAASGGGSERLVVSSQHGDPASWTRDGRMLAYSEVSPTTSWDIWVYDAAAGKAVPFLRTAAAERNPAISPGGRWLAYCSNTSGREEVYAEAFPAGGHRIRISSDGGAEPLWSADGRELFYRSGTALMRVAIEEAQELTPGKPSPLFGVTSFAPAGTFGPVSYAVAADGKFFYFVKLAPLPPEPTRIHVVLGWIDEFTRSLKR